MGKEEINEILENDAKRYLSWWCNHTPNMFKFGMFQSTVDLIQELEAKYGIAFVYHDTELLFDLPPELNQKTYVVPDSRLGNAGGAYEFGSNPPTIRMNIKTQDSAIEQYGTTVHESGHRSQDKLTLLENKYPKGSIENEFLILLKSNVDPIKNYTMFDMHFDGPVYVKNNRNIENNVLKRLKNAFYRLSITERYANVFEKQCIEKFSGRTAEIIDMRMDRAVNAIRNRYHCNEFSEREICDLVDKAHLNLYLGKSPTTELETRIMYDLIAALAHEKKYLSDAEYIKTASEKYVSHAIAEWNVNHPSQKVPFGAKTMSEDLNDLNYLYWHQIAHLDPHVLINNPKILARAIVDYGDDGVKLMFDKNLSGDWCLDAFKDWCWSEKNTLSDSQLDCIAEHLGGDFSYNKCRNEIQKRIDRRQELDRQREIDERIHIAEKCGFGRQILNDDICRNNIDGLDDIVLELK